MALFLKNLLKGRSYLVSSRQGAIERAYSNSLSGSGLNRKRKLLAPFTPIPPGSTP